MGNARRSRSRETGEGICNKIQFKRQGKNFTSQRIVAYRDQGGAMLASRAVNRKYNFQDMKIEEIRLFDYQEGGKVRCAVHFANKRGDGQFICRVIKKGNVKKTAVQRIA